MRKIPKINNKGFTLIEILGVIVIIGIILIAVLPSLSQLIHNNDTKELESYYSVIEEAAHVYASKLTDQLGSSRYTGCAEIRLKDLIDSGFVKEYSDKYITCKTGSGNIKIRNDKGAITVNFQLSCSEDDEAIFLTGINDTNTCEAYVLENSNTLKNKIEENTSNERININNEVYIIGNDSHNYVWYSGKMWQIVSYNAATEVTKAVTVNPITSIYYNSAASNSSLYSGSDVETWLNTEFLNSLKEPQNFLINGNWNSTPNASQVDNPVATEKIKKAKVGLLTTFEYGKVKAWYGNVETWLISEGVSGNSLYSSAGEVKNISSKTILGVRPAIYFNSDVKVYSGTGTLYNPYIIDDSSNSVGQAGEYLNTRFSGEYVKVGMETYRIVSNKNGALKIIGTKKVDFDDQIFSNTSYDFTTSNLKTVFSGLGSELSIAEPGEFCMDTINSANATYQSSACLTSSRVVNLEIGLPKIGDMFTTALPDVYTSYWTMNPNTETDGSGNVANATMNLMNTNGQITTSTISSPNASVIVVSVNRNAKIISGIGTIDNPYIIEL